MEGILKGDDIGSSGGVPRDFDRILHRLGATIYQQSFFGERSGRHLGEAPGEFHVWFVNGNGKAHVNEFLGLLLNRLHDLAGSMSDIERANTSREIDVTFAVNVPDLGAMGALHDYMRVGRHAARYPLRAFGPKSHRTARWLKSDVHSSAPWLASVWV